VEGARGRRLLALWRRAEPADARRFPAVLLRAGRGDARAESRRALRPGEPGEVQDLVQLDADVLHDLRVLRVVALDQGVEFFRARDVRIEPARGVQLLLHVGGFAPALQRRAQLRQRRLRDARRAEQPAPDRVLESRIELGYR